VFSQTPELISVVKDTPNDSINQLTSLKHLLIKSVKLEYSGKEALDKYTDIAIVYYSKDILDFSQDFFELALSVAESIDDKEKKAEILSNIGVLNEIRGDYIAALKNYQESLQIFNELGNERSQSVVYNNIAIIHQELGNIDLAYQNLTISYQMKLEIQDSSLIASALNNYGVFYEECNVNLDSAILYYQAAKNMYSDFGDSLNEAICTSNIAQVLQSQGEFILARESFSSAINVFRNLQQDMWVSKTLMYLAELELQLNRHDIAVELLEESRTIILTGNNPRTLLQISEILAESYMQNGQFEKSAIEFQKCEMLRDSLLNIDKQNEISSLEIKFQTSQKQHEIDSLKIEKEIQQQRTNLIVWFVTALVILLISVIVFLYMRGKHRKLEKQNKSMQLKQQLLQNQMNPHFLFNSINSVNALIATDPDKAREMLVNLSDYFRYSLKQKDINFISLEDELHYTFTYFEIEKLRFGDRIEVKIEMDENVKTTRLPVMILQPLFENVIKHAVSESLVTVHLLFTAKIEEGFLNIQLVNNYDPESVSRKGSGIGLSTTAERLSLIFGDKNLLNYSKRDGIFSVELKVPQQN